MALVWGGKILVALSRYKDTTTTLEIHCSLAVKQTATLGLRHIPHTGQHLPQPVMLHHKVAYNRALLADQ